jgi:hypothetical protein
MLQKTKPAACGAPRGSENIVSVGYRNGVELNPSHDEQQERVIWSLHVGRSRKPLVQIVPDDGSPLYRIAWGDIGMSPAANLARCLEAARRWAERQYLTDHRKMNSAQRLKSLDNFWWSWSYVRQNDAGVS